MTSDAENAWNWYNVKSTFLIALQWYSRGPDKKYTEIQEPSDLVCKLQLQ